MARTRIKLVPAGDPPTDNYFTGPKENLRFVGSGCTLLDCALGGGYPLGRVANIVGDRSTGKTWLATEAIINFLIAYPDGKAKYAESEAAYDRGYVAEMGLDIGKVDFGNPENPLTTVEEFAHDLEEFLDRQIKAGQPGIYVLDSLDALSDEAEMSRDLEKGTYGMQKAKNLSIMFRKLTRKLERSQVLLIVVSQVRDNINAMFGEKHRRSGGRALDFYASQIQWLAHIKTIKKTINKVERPVAILIKSNLKKNKVGLPFRTCEFEFEFGFGINDLKASLNWLQETGRLGEVDLNDNSLKEYIKTATTFTTEEYIEESKKYGEVVKRVWREIETDFIPTRKKYPTKEKSNAPT